MALRESTRICCRINAIWCMNRREITAERSRSDPCQSGSNACSEQASIENFHRCSSKKDALRNCSYPKELTCSLLGQRERRMRTHRTRRHFAHREAANSALCGMTENPYSENQSKRMERKELTCEARSRRLPLDRHGARRHSAHGLASDIAAGGSAAFSERREGRARPPAKRGRKP